MTTAPNSTKPPLPPALERTGIETFFADLTNGVRLSVRACGPDPATHPGTPVLMFLHGFPEAAFVWDEVMLALGNDPMQPVRCIAPNLRGFEYSSSPVEVESYRAKHICADITLLTAQVAPRGLSALVAHDWGGAIAWNLAIAQTAGAPRLMERLVILNSPHPYTFWRELMHSPEQQASSAYMNFLCRPDAERLLAENDFARMWPFFTNARPGVAPKPWLDEAEKARFRAVWSMGMTGGCNYYRASPLKPKADGSTGAGTITMTPEQCRISLPVSVLWGMGDIALGPSLLDGLEECIPKLHVERLDDATHWLVHEQPKTVGVFVRAAISR